MTQLAQFTSHLSLLENLVYLGTDVDLLPESWRVMGLGVVSSDPVEHTDVLCPALRFGSQSAETGDSSSPLSPWTHRGQVRHQVNSYLVLSVNNV